MSRIETTNNARQVLNKLGSVEFDHDNSLSQNEVIIFGDNKNDESSFLNDGLMEMLENNEAHPQIAYIANNDSGSDPPEDMEGYIVGSEDNSPTNDIQTPSASPDRKKKLQPKRRISKSKGSRPGSERTVRNQKTGPNILKDLVQRQMEAAEAKNELRPFENERIDMKKEKGTPSLPGSNVRLSSRISDNGALSSRAKENNSTNHKTAGRSNLKDSEIFQTMMKAHYQVKTEGILPFEEIESEKARESPVKKPMTLQNLHINMKEAEEGVVTRNRPTGAAFEARPATKRYMPATLSGVMHTISQQETMNKNLINEKLNPEVRTRRSEVNNEVLGGKIKPVKIEDVKKMHNLQHPNREPVEEVTGEVQGQLTPTHMTSGAKKPSRQKEDSQPKKPHQQAHTSKDIGGRRAGSLHLAKDEQQPFRKEYKLHTLDTFLKSKNATAK